jgi:hypothetical protein
VDIVQANVTLGLRHIDLLSSIRFGIDKGYRVKELDNICTGTNGRGDVWCEPEDTSCLNGAESGALREYETSVWSDGVAFRYLYHKTNKEIERAVLAAGHERSTPPED